MTQDPPENTRAPRLAVRESKRAGWALAGEKVIEGLVYLCGFSAIIFVLGIFIFVLKEALPVLTNKNFSLVEFLFSSEWYPTSEANKRYGVFAMIVGTASVTMLAMAIAVPFGLGAAIYLSEFCGQKTRERSRSS